MAALSGLGAPAKVAVCVVRLFPAAYGGKSRRRLSGLYGTPLSPSPKPMSWGAAGFGATCSHCHACICAHERATWELTHSAPVSSISFADHAAVTRATFVGSAVTTVLWLAGQVGTPLDVVCAPPTACAVSARFRLGAHSNHSSDAVTQGLRAGSRVSLYRVAVSHLVFSSVSASTAQLFAQPGDA